MNAHRILSTLAAIVLAATNLIAQDLFPFEENGLSGFMNVHGDVVILPRFTDVGLFTDGLAPACGDGRYGYIDTTGAFRIAPLYDYAERFDSGVAKVYLGSKPFFIDTAGTTLFDHDYLEIIPVTRDRAVVITERKRMGVVDMRGEEIIRAKYKWIDLPQSGPVAFVLLRGSGRHGSEYAVADIDGKIVVPFERYEVIKPFHDGYALATIRLSEERDRDVFITPQGIEQFVLRDSLFRYKYDAVPSDGLIVVSGIGFKEGLIGLADSTGRILFSTRDFKQLCPFRDGRGFALTHGRDWYLVDTTGSRVIEQSFSDIAEPGFVNGIAYVERMGRWFAIDGEGRIVSGHLESEQGHEQVVDGVLFLQKSRATDDDPYRYAKGMLDARHNVVIPVLFDDVVKVAPSASGAVLYEVTEEGRRRYLKRLGEHVGREPADPTARPANITYMNRGYYYASSPLVVEYAGVGGWGESDNTFRRISDPEMNNGELYVNARSDESTMLGRHTAFPLYVVNTTDDTMLFDAQDSRLYLKIQAKDPEGEWRDIEYLPSSWCGNSYHTLFLPPGTYWTFATPRYAGSIKTRLRAQILYRRPGDDYDDSRVLYSNEYDGSVNPGQFWRKLDYTPMGIMDPYND